MKYKYIFLVVLVLSIGACRKSSFLDASPDDALLIPSKLSDFQKLIDNDIMLNGNDFQGVNIAYGLVGSDEYYIASDDYYNSLPLAVRNLYIWNDDIYSEHFYEWNIQYRAISYANTVLDGLKKLTVKPEDQNLFNAINGSAFFFRAEMLYQLGEVFAPAYDESTAKTDLSVVLRLTSDINEKVKRATVQEVYDQVIKDLTDAIGLLPATSTIKTRPSKAAAYGLLSRVYLSMRKYDSALENANAALQLYHELLNFDTEVLVDDPSPMLRYNKEVIFHSLFNQNYNYLTTFYARVDTNLLAQYAADDLRLSAFYQQVDDGKSFKGSYDGTMQQWAGIATDELYLITAECYARKNDIVKSMNDLNTLLVTRWKSGTFVNMTAIDANDALQKVLLERRKELPFRGLRWNDIRRLNKENANIKIERIVNGQHYILQPNSKNSIYLIPPDVINANPTMPQNAR